MRPSLTHPRSGEFARPKYAPSDDCLLFYLMFYPFTYSVLETISSGQVHYLRNYYSYAFVVVTLYTGQKTPGLFDKKPHTDSKTTLTEGSEAFVLIINIRVTV